MTKEEIQKKLEALQASRQQALNALIAHDGAIEFCKSLLAEASKAEEARAAVDAEEETK